MKPRSGRIHLALSALTAIAVVAGGVGLVTDADALVGGALLLVGVIGVAAVLWTNNTLRKLVRALERSVDARAGRTEAVLLEGLADTRKKQSRHEYHHGLALDRIEKLTAEVRGAAEGILWQFHPGAAETLTFRGGAPGAARVLLVSSNGGGVGHLTRLLAVARRAERDVAVSVLTLSTAHRVVAELGYPVHYFPSKEASGLPYDAWHRSFSQFFDTLLRTNHIDAVLFDGSWLYRGISESCGRQQVPLVWSCRGLWRPGADQQQLRSWRGLATSLVVPGEALLEEDDSLGVTDYQRTSPITVFSRAELLGRDAARERLGLATDGKYALIQVGGGNMADTSSVREAALAAVRGLGEEWTAVVARSPLSREEVGESAGMRVISTYPLAPCLAAFDFAVTAAGYNSVHENIVACLPTVLVPSDETLTDDQPRRAHLLAAHGMGYEARSETDLRRVINKLGLEYTRAAFRATLSSLEWSNGADELAELVKALGQADHTNPSRQGALGVPVRLVDEV